MFAISGQPVGFVPLARFKQKTKDTLALGCPAFSRP
jgi:hypothetical protein